jgi:TolA-binding protein
MAKGEIEDRLRAYQRDDELATSVPSSLVTYRTIVTRYREADVAEQALWKLGQAYVSVKRYELAAQAFTDLASRYPSTQYDAWFAAAEQFDKRLHDPSRAQAAYERVPSSSPEFKTAQKRLNR